MKTKKFRTYYCVTVKDGLGWKTLFSSKPIRLMKILGKYQVLSDGKLFKTEGTMMYPSTRMLKTNHVYKFKGRQVKIMEIEKELTN